MQQTRAARAPQLAARVCGQAARREDSRVARRWYRTPVVDGVDPLAEGALRDDFFSCLHELGVVDWRGEIQGPAVQRAMVPGVHDRLRDGRKTLVGIASRHALPARLCRDEARMRLVGCNAPQGRHGGCPRGAAPRQGPRPSGPLGPEALADNRVTRTGRAWEAWFNGGSRALATVGMVAPKGTGLVEATALETTAPDAGWGHVTRTRKSTATRGHVHALAGPVYGGTLSVVLAARPKIPSAGQVVPIKAPAGRSMRARVTPARPHLAGHARLHKGVLEKGVWAGGDRWWLAQRGIPCVVPATDPRAVPVEARAHATAGAGIPVGRRVHPVRQGPGRAARTERLETAVGGITGLTTSAPSGTPAHGRHANRRAWHPHAITAGGVRQWPGRD